MGCKPSKHQNGDLFKEDTSVRKKSLTGLQALRSNEGLEGNIQIAFVKTKVKRYERPTLQPIEEEIENTDTPIQSENNNAT